MGGPSPKVKLEQITEAQTLTSEDWVVTSGGRTEMDTQWYWLFVDIRPRQDYQVNYRLHLTSFR
ncbi:mCG1038740 [Mus musculus]|nr:mCG1038740 [Mus musculus]